MDPLVRESYDEAAVLEPRTRSLIQVRGPLGWSKK